MDHAPARRPRRSSGVAARMWSICPCTPPSDTTPIRCARPPEAFSGGDEVPGSPRSRRKLPSSIARSIWPRSIATTRPAPMFVWPTSELPIWPVGRPTSRPEVTSVRMRAGRPSAGRRSGSRPARGRWPRVVVQAPAIEDAQNDGFRRRHDGSFIARLPSTPWWGRGQPAGASRAPLRPVPRQ